MSTFIPYQVDYSVKNTAKTLGFSKKKVIFSFGFASQEALNQNLTGAACRGSEHQVTFVWSLKTGKRQLFVDGKEVHYSETRQNGWTQDRAWQHSFRLKDSTVSGLKVHFISQPVNRDIPDSRPFDLRVGGTSYFNFNQIFHLGTPQMVVRGGSRRPGASPESDAFLSPEERRHIAQAKLESLKDIERQSSPNRARTASNATTAQAMNREEGALISFDDDPAPPAGPPQPVPITQTGSGGYYNPQFASSITLDPAIDDSKPSYQAGPAMPGAPLFAGGAPPPNPAGYPTNPYAPPQQQQPPQQPYAAAPGALTTYQPPAGYPAPSSYALGTAPGNLGFNNHQPLPSPSAASMASYGSAPSFAQPPKPPSYPQQQQPQPYYPQQAPQYNPYAPPQQQPPPQQQQQQQQPPSYY